MAPPPYDGGIDEKVGGGSLAADFKIQTED